VLDVRINKLYECIYNLKLIVNIMIHA